MSPCLHSPRNSLYFCQILVFEHSNDSNDKTMSAESEGQDNPPIATAPIVEDVESGENLTFNPPVYIQRYQAVADLLNEDRWRKAVKTVSDVV